MVFDNFSDRLTPYKHKVHWFLVSSRAQRYNTAKPIKSNMIVVALQSNGRLINTDQRDATDICKLALLLVVQQVKWLLLYTHVVVVHHLRLLCVGWRWLFFFVNVCQMEKVVCILFPIFLYSHGAIVLCRVNVNQLKPIWLRQGLASPEPGSQKKGKVLPTRSIYKS